MIIRYIAKRSIIGAHALGVQYDLQVNTSKKSLKRQNIGLNGSAARESVALSGLSEMTVARQEKVYSLATVEFLKGLAEYDEIIEALESIGFGEAYFIDIDRTGDFVEVKSIKPYREERLATLRHFKFSFDARVI